MNQDVDMLLGGTLQVLETSIFFLCQMIRLVNGFNWEILAINVPLH